MRKIVLNTIVRPAGRFRRPRRSHCSRRVGALAVLAVVAGVVSAPAAAGSEGPPRTISIGAVTGGTVRSHPAGIACPPTCSAAFPDGTPDVVVYAVPDPGFVTGAWTGGCDTVDGRWCFLRDLDADATVGVTFEGEPIVPRTVTVGSTGGGYVGSHPAGIACPPTCSATFPSDTDLVVFAAPDPGFEVGTWLGACAGETERWCTPDIAAGDALLAIDFTGAPPVGHTVAVTPPEHGTVGSFPPGIACPPACSTGFATGTEVILYAAAEPGFEVDPWTGACTGAAERWCVIDSLDTDVLVGVTFTGWPVADRTVHVELTGDGDGGVTSWPPGISCPPTCTATFAGDTRELTLFAVPAPGSATYRLYGDGCVAVQATCWTDDLTRNIGVSVEFGVPLPEPPAPVTVTVDDPSPGGRIMSPDGRISCPPSCSETFDGNEEVLLIAIPDDGYEIEQWTGACVGTLGTACWEEPSTGFTAGVQLVPVPEATITVNPSTGGRVTTDANDVACPPDCTATVRPETERMFLAHAAPGYEFVRWSGSCFGPAPVCPLRVDGNLTMEAVFQATDETVVTVVDPSPGGRITSDIGGIACPPACSAVVPPGEPLLLFATPDPDHAFSSWSSGCASTEPVCLLGSDATVGATFALIERAPLDVTTTVGGRVLSDIGGIACPPTCGASYAPETDVLLLAVADPGYHLFEWVGCAEAALFCAVTAGSADHGAVFVPDETRQLEVRRAGTGAGTVTGGPIDCGTTCTFPIARGLTVELTATPEPGSTFVGWSGACAGTGSCSVVLDSDTVVTASFAPPPRVLTVGFGGSGFGQVFSSGVTPGFDCDLTLADCIESFPPGTEVPLQSAPAGGSRFVGWLGYPGCSTNPSCIVVVPDRDLDITAVFELAPAPQVVVGNATITETNGRQQVVVPVSLTMPSAVPVTVALDVNPGTARFARDYTGSGWRFTFRPGQMSRGVSLNIQGDVISESTEHFYLDVIEATGAPVLVGRGVITILDDDGTPTLSVDDVVAIETDDRAHATKVYPSFRLNVPVDHDVVVLWHTENRTAGAPSDYRARVARTSVIPAGRRIVTTMQVIRNDNRSEETEEFAIVIDSVVDVPIADGEGVVTILDDDAPPLVPASGTLIVREPLDTIDIGQLVNFAFSLNVETIAVDVQGMLTDDVVRYDSLVLQAWEHRISVAALVGDPSWVDAPHSEVHAFLDDLGFYNGIVNQPIEEVILEVLPWFEPGVDPEAATDAWAAMMDGIGALGAYDATEPLFSVMIPSYVDGSSPPIDDLVTAARGFVNRFIVVTRHDTSAAIIPAVEHELDRVDDGSDVRLVSTHIDLRPGPASETFGDDPITHLTAEVATVTAAMPEGRWGGHVYDGYTNLYQLHHGAPPPAPGP